MMIKVKDALSIILENIKTLEAEKVKLTKALNRVLAQDIYADSDIPGFANSAMDGYAVRSADLKGASPDNPKVLEVVDDIKAGDIPKKRLKENQAIRIMTGAMIPKGADSVVIVEDTEKIKNQKSILRIRSGLMVSEVEPSKIKNKEWVKIFKETEPGENIRKKGEDIKKGELVVRSGTLLEPAHIGVLASLGKTEVKVTRKPKVAILATGDEIVDVEEKLRPGKIRSSNTYTLYSQTIKCGAIPKNLGIVKDDPHKLEKRIKKGLACDLMLTSGGVSVGDYDLVKDVLAKLGTQMKFWKVAMRPGKPLAFGYMGGIPVFGLPGNPVSSMVAFEVFVKPAILKMLGQKEDKDKEVEAILEEEIRKKSGFRYFLRAQTSWKEGRYFTRTTGPQGSGILKSFVLANSLIILPEDKEFVKKGERVQVRFLD